MRIVKGSQTNVERDCERLEILEIEWHYVMYLFDYKQETKQRHSHKVCLGLPFFKKPVGDFDL